MTTLQAILFPIIEVMRLILDMGYAIFHSHGASIILLSIVVTIVTWPISRYADKLQKAENALQKQMAPRIHEVKQNLKGEQQFLEIEKIYKEHNYHPIKSVRSVAGLALQIPFLLSALLLLLSYPPLVETSFGVLHNLSKPDALLGLSFGAPILPDAVNILPFFMVALSVTESYISPTITAANRLKANLVAGVLFLLVYALPAAVVLYWTCNNCWSLLRAFYARYSVSRREKRAAVA